MRGKEWNSRILCQLLVLGLLIAGACSKRPSNVLSEDKMVKLMVDMEIAESYASQQSSSNDYRIELGRQVLAKHGVSEETLDTTLAWYGRNMDEYSALFEKIDKEILKRKKKYSDNPVETQSSLANLWPYSTHQIISPLANSEVMNFSISNPNIPKGNIVELSFLMANGSNVKGTIGVEYTDGTGEAVVNNNSGKNKFLIDIQSDTAKTVSRLYGFVQFKEKDRHPIFIDSLAITLLPIDSATYSQKKRNQKQYGALYNRKPVVKVEKPDTIAAVDTIPKNDSLNIEQEVAAKPEEVKGETKSTLNSPDQGSTPKKTSPAPMNENGIRPKETKSAEANKLQPMKSK